MLLSHTRTQLLIIDMQEKFMPALHEPQQVSERCVRLIEAAKLLDIPITYSEQYPKGLGPTIEPVQQALGNAARFEKLHFSCAADDAIAAHVEGLAKEGRDQLVIAGVEAHVCVLQTAFGFQEKGLTSYVVADAVTSREASSVDLATRRLQAGGVDIINSEMALFEWMEISGTATFKAISPLVK